jgi:hypothetical protein
MKQLVLEVANKYTSCPTISKEWKDTCTEAEKRVQDLEQMMMTHHIPTEIEVPFEIVEEDDEDESNSGHQFGYEDEEGGIERYNNNDEDDGEYNDDDDGEELIGSVDDYDWASDEEEDLCATTVKTMTITQERKPLSLPFSSQKTAAAATPPTATKLYPFSDYCCPSVCSLHSIHLDFSEDMFKQRLFHPHQGSLLIKHIGIDDILVILKETWKQTLILPLTLSLPFSTPPHFFGYLEHLDSFLLSSSR